MGKIPILTTIFQRGWSHQLEKEDVEKANVLSHFSHLSSHHGDFHLSLKPFALKVNYIKLPYATTGFFLEDLLFANHPTCGLSLVTKLREHFLHVKPRVCRENPGETLRRQAQLKTFAKAYRSKQDIEPWKRRFFLDIGGGMWWSFFSPLFVEDEFLFQKKILRMFFFGIWNGEPPMLGVSRQGGIFGISLLQNCRVIWSLRRLLPRQFIATYLLVTPKGSEK